MRFGLIITASTASSSATCAARPGVGRATGRSSFPPPGPGSRRACAIRYDIVTKRTALGRTGARRRPGTRAIVRRTVRRAWVGTRVTKANGTARQAPGHGGGAAMQRLSGMDASFLYLETASMHMHVTGVIVLDPRDVPGGYSFDLVRQMLEERIHLLPPFRRRLATVPFGLGHPSWVEDPDFNLDLHVRRIGLPSPGSMHELAEVVGDIGGRPLDR